jgi:hypothetical protein
MSNPKSELAKIRKKIQENFIQGEPVEKKEQEERVEYDEYKGNPMIMLPAGKNKATGEVYWFKFGVQKAKAIIKYLEDIKTFIQINEKGNENGQV